MNSSDFLEWIAALLICCISLTAIYRFSSDPTRCEVQKSADSRPQSLWTNRPEWQSEAMIREMMLHD